MVPMEQLTPRIEACANALFDLYWSATAHIESRVGFGTLLRREFGKQPAKLQMSQELYMLHQLGTILAELGPVIQQQSRSMIESLRTEEKPKPAKLTVPMSEREGFRRELLRSLFDALTVGYGAERQSMQLGAMLFRAADDGQRLDAK